MKDCGLIGASTLATLTFWLHKQDAWLPFAVSWEKPSCATIAATLSLVRCFFQVVFCLFLLISVTRRAN
jgi:hypothetical protein